MTEARRLERSQGQETVRQQAARLGRRMIWGTVEVHRQVSIGLVLAAPVIGFLMSKIAQGVWLWALLAGQLVVAAATWLLGEGRASKLQEERLEGRQEALVVLGNALEPILIELARTVQMNTSDRRKEGSGLRNLILSAATGLGDESRACYFQLEEPGAGQRRLVHKLSVGRAVQAKAEFQQGTVAGDAALAMVDEGDYLFCDDVEENPPPGWVPSERGEYRTFISVSVRSGATPHGMLTLDAVEVGALTTEDTKVLLALGHLLAMAETVTA